MRLNTRKILTLPLALAVGWMDVRGKDHRQSAAELRSRQEPTTKQSQELRDFLDRCVQETPSLTEMAETLGRSESQTIRTFKRDRGLAPYQFLIERKLQKAQVLLTGTTKAVKEIAAELGFNDE